MEVGGGDVLFKVGNFGGPGNGQDDRGPLEEPGQGELGYGSAVAGGDLGQGGRARLLGLEELAGGDGIPGQKADSLLLAVVDCLLVAPVGETVSILDSCDLDDLPGLLDLGWSNFAEADVADLALVLEVFESAEALFERGEGVDAVKLVEINAVEFQAAEAEGDALLEVAGAADVFSLAGAGANNAALGGDDDAGGVGGERLADHLLGNLGAVGVCCVNEGDAELDGAEQDTTGLGGVVAVAPGVVAHQAHGAKAHALNGEVAADEEGSAGGCGGDWTAHVDWMPGDGWGCGGSVAAPGTRGNSIAYSD